jgi:multidrug efflux pump subunit AcrA (membrane-fusion protein)
MRVAEPRFDHWSECLALLMVSISYLACESPGTESQGFKKMGADRLEILDLSRVTVARAESRKFPVGVELPGRITIPDKDIITLSARVQGRLEAIDVSIGDSVQPYARVGSIWSPDLSTAVEELEVARAQGSPSLVELTEKKLHSMGVSKGDARRGIDSFPLRSPVGGVVLEKKLSAGAAVQPGDAIMVIGKLGAHQFQGELPPDQAARIHQGMAVVFEGAPELRAEVESVSPVADPGSRLTRVRARFTTAPPKQFPQETLLSARVVLNEISGLVVPAKALLVSGGHECVFVRVPGKDPVFRRVPVKLAGRTPTEILLEAPEPGTLVEGTEVISEGALLVNEILEDSE